MLNLILFALLLAVALTAYSGIRRQRATLNDALNRWSRAHALDIVRYDRLPEGAGRMKITFRRHGLREFEECVVGWRPDLLGSSIDPPPAPSQAPSQLAGPRPHALLDGMSPATMSPASMSRATMSPHGVPARGRTREPATFDDRVRLEVAQRLDAITSKPGWAKDYDLDGSGHIDDHEWQRLRQNLEREVRAELARAAEEAPAGAFGPESDSGTDGSVRPPADDSWKGGAW